MSIAYLSLGSNKGNRQLWLDNAIELLGQNAGVILKMSSRYETKAWGISEQPDFINMCLQLQTSLSAIELLHTILQTETTLGRVRDIKWGPRTIDIDILFYENAIINSEGLLIPHPHLQERRFILMPLIDIAPCHIHPVLNKRVNELLKECTDELAVSVIINRE